MSPREESNNNAYRILYLSTKSTVEVNLSKNGASDTRAVNKDV